MSKVNVTMTLIFPKVVWKCPLSHIPYSVQVCCIRHIIVLYIISHKSAILATKEYYIFQPSQTTHTVYTLNN